MCVVLPLDTEPGDRKEAIHYFRHILPKIKAAEGDQLQAIDCIQGPGETIFVPGGWWHAVLNLDETMAVTQNFMHPHLFDEVWKDFRSNRKKLSHFFLKMLKKKQPGFYERALELNRKDKFVMFPDRPKKPSAVPFKEDDTTTSIDYSSSSGTDKSSSTSYDSRDAELNTSESEVSQRKKKKKRTQSNEKSPSKASSRSSRSSSNSSSNFRSRSRSQERKSAQTNKHTSTS
jgi:histone arginine demethylase JMJD6